MEKVKLLVELDKDDYKRVMMFPNALNSLYCQAIRNGIPVTDDIISRSALRKNIKNAFKHNFYGYDALMVNEIYAFIDHASTIGDKNNGTEIS